MYDAQQMKAPLNIMIRSPKFFIRMDEIKANKNIVEEWVDCIHDTFIVVLSSWLMIVLITTPKLVSIPIAPANVKKAPKHTNHEPHESFWILHIFSVTKYNRLTLTTNSHFWLETIR